VRIAAATLAAPFDRDDRLALGIAFPATKPSGQIHDPLISLQAEQWERRGMD